MKSNVELYQYDQVAPVRVREPGNTSKTGREVEGASKRQWGELIVCVRSGNPDRLSQLNEVFGRGLRFILSRQMQRKHIEETVLDVFRNVIAELERGSLPEPQGLPRLVLMMARRIVGHSSHPVPRGQPETGIQLAANLGELNGGAERQQMIQQKSELAEQTLSLMSSQQLEILSRRYLCGQAIRNKFAQK